MTVGTAESDAANTSQEGGKESEPTKSTEKSTNPLKVVLRRLPPSMTEEELKEQLSPLPPHDWFSFVPADESLHPWAYSRAYIAFPNAQSQDVIIFRDQFDGYVFVDSKGVEYQAMVELAPFPKIPKQHLKKIDPKSGTIENDPDYLSFLEELNNPEPEKPMSMDQNLEALEKKEKERLASKGEPKMTPLVEFLIWRREEKWRKKDEKRRLREDERRRRVEKDMEELAKRKEEKARRERKEKEAKEKTLAAVAEEADDSAEGRRKGSRDERKIGDHQQQGTSGFRKPVDPPRYKSGSAATSSRVRTEPHQHYRGGVKSHDDDNHEEESDDRYYYGGVVSRYPKPPREREGYVAKDTKSSRPHQDTVKKEYKDVGSSSGDKRRFPPSSGEKIRSGKPPSTEMSEAENKSDKKSSRPKEKPSIPLYQPGARRRAAQYAASKNEEAPKPTTADDQH